MFVLSSFRRFRTVPVFAVLQGREARQARTGPDPAEIVEIQTRSNSKWKHHIRRTGSCPNKTAKISAAEAIWVYSGG
jgi:hypothetical protein